jgi:predicted N-acetyltransferase YhbS
MNLEAVPVQAAESLLRLRVATAADATRLIELINRAFAVETFLDGTRTDADRLAAAMAKGSILLAEDEDGRLLASVYMEPRGARGYLGMLAVDPSLQGRGLGRRMVQAAEEWLRAESCEAADITVLSLRPELPPLYRKLGYVETGVEEINLAERLQDGMECHAIVMSKAL